MRLPGLVPGPGNCARAISCHAGLRSAVVISARSSTSTKARGADAIDAHVESELSPADSTTCGLLGALPAGDRDCPRLLIRSGT